MLRGSRRAGGGGRAVYTGPRRARAATAISPPSTAPRTAPRGSGWAPARRPASSTGAAASSAADHAIAASEVERGAGDRARARAAARRRAPHSSAPNSSAGAEQRPDDVRGGAADRALPARPRRDPGLAGRATAAARAAARRAAATSSRAPPARTAGASDSPGRRAAGNAPASPIRPSTGASRAPSHSTGTCPVRSEGTAASGASAAASSTARPARPVAHSQISAASDSAVASRARDARGFGGQRRLWRGRRGGGGRGSDLNPVLVPPRRLDGRPAREPPGRRGARALAGPAGLAQRVASDLLERLLQRQTQVVLLAPLARRRGERAIDRRGQAPRQVAATAAERLQTGPDAPRRGGRRRPADGVDAGERLVEDQRERVQVGLLADLAAFALLGRHVGERPQHVAGAGQRVLLGDAGAAEVGQLRRRPGTPRVALGRDEHVLGLDVAVDDAALVGVVERVEQVDADLQRLLVVDARPRGSARRAWGPARARRSGRRPRPAEHAS